jgi:hypothetical protein
MQTLSKLQYEALQIVEEACSKSGSRHDAGAVGKAAAPDEERATRLTEMSAGFSVLVEFSYCMADSTSLSGVVTKPVA